VPDADEAECLERRPLHVLRLVTQEVEDRGEHSHFCIAPRLKKVENKIEKKEENILPTIFCFQARNASGKVNVIKAPDPH
jgi:hypothetical protein